MASRIPNDASSGKLLLKQLREERQVQQEQKDYEFNQEARSNFENGRMLRESMTNKARTGGGIFSSEGGDAKAPPPKPTYKGPTYHEAANENYDAPMQSYGSYPQARAAPPRKSSGTFTLSHPEEDSRRSPRRTAKGGT